MIEIQITEKQIVRAQELYSFSNLKDSITSGKNQIYGALGEIIFLDYFTSQGILVKHVGYFDYDMIVNGVPVEIKTKATAVVPKPHYFCSIDDDNTFQACDYYFFVRILTDKSKGWLLGAITKYRFFKEALFKKKGEKDMNGFSFTCDCWNTEIRNLDREFLFVPFDY